MSALLVPCLHYDRGEGRHELTYKLKVNKYFSVWGP
jgi:hypothetical protein